MAGKGSREARTLTACEKTAGFHSADLEVLVGPCSLARGHPGDHEGPAMWVAGASSGSPIVLSGRPGARWAGAHR